MSLRLKIPICYIIPCVCIIYVLVMFIPKRELYVMVPKHLQQRYIRFDASYRVHCPNMSLGVLFNKLTTETDEPTVRNWDKFGPLFNDAIVIVVLVHTAADHLQYLIVSLAQVRDIHTAMIIFSHSFYDKGIEDLIATIDFCLVKQIYFPNSVQLFPQSFPGVDIGDCSHSMNEKNESCADRDGRLTESKHHWWWTANVVFGKQWTWMRSHRGPVVFLREENYVLPDLVYMVGFAQRALSAVPQAEVMSFGRPPANELDYDKLVVDAWRPTYEHGVAFNISTWTKILSLASYYCLYDDVSWSYSLLAVFTQFSRGRVLTLSSSAPRVLSTARMMKSGRESLFSLAPVVSAAQPLLFPPHVQAVLLYGQDGMVVKDLRTPPHGNGGWGDYRDRNLCLEPLLATNYDDDSTTSVPNFATCKFHLG